MAQHSKLILAFLLFAICSKTQGQEKCVSMHENVFFYLTESENKTQKHTKKNTRKSRRNDSLTLTLLIVNQSEDSIHIENFDKNIFLRQEPIKTKKAFTWEFLTLSNQVPDDVVVMIAHNPMVRPLNKNQVIEESMKIVIPPNSTFVSEIYIRHSPYWIYRKGKYYKLRLYYGTERCVAEMVIKYE